MTRYYKKIVKTYEPGENIISEDGEDKDMFIIEEGRVKVYKLVETKSGITEMELVQLGPKSLFGEMALIDNQKRSASVKAIERTTCLVITKSMYDDQIKQLPSWVLNLIKVLVVRLRETNEKLRKKANVYGDDTGGLFFVDDDKKGDMVDNLKDEIESIVNIPIDDINI